MTQSTGGTPRPAIFPLLIGVADAVAHLRSTLESQQIDTLAQVLVQAQQAIDAIQAYPGGVPALQADIDLLDSTDRERALQMLRQASTDHRINGELIRLATQRNAALQAFVAQQSATATYSPEGAVSHEAGRTFSHKA